MTGRRVLVVGSGAAGLTVALRASVTADVLLVTKDALAESNTRYAQGGIAAAWDDADSSRAHAVDTLAAGAGLGVADRIAELTQDGPARIRELIDLGVDFDRDADGRVALGLEAAHSVRRVLHAGGDATGAAIEAALVAAVRSAGPSLEVREQTMLLDLVVRDGAVVGALLLDDSGTVREEAADAVVLATGGAGRLYAHTTNPAVATGDGVAAAWRAGAAIADAEFLQFHPTALAIPPHLLISEAVRGDGAVLLDAAGRRFMQDLHPDAELAPRDVVARGIARTMAAQGGLPVRLDATALGAARLAARFPTIDAAVRGAGLDWATEPIPVTPAAHYWMGGIATDGLGRTSLPGLFAVGEAAANGVHGANRLASNSLLDALVSADRCGRALLLPPEAARVEAAEVPAPATSGVPGVPFTRAALQERMWADAGLVRTEDALLAAAADIAAWRGCAAFSDRTDVPTREVAEDRNLLDVASLVVDGALARRESRGAHARADFPEPDPGSRRRIVRAVGVVPAPTHRHLEMDGTC